jgi:hypothetical protein
MTRRKSLSLIFSLACVVCLAVGFAMVGQWLFMPGILLALSAWLFSRKQHIRPLIWIALLASVCLAAAGVFAGAPTALMLLSATLALAGWDGMLMDASLAGDASTDTLSLLETKHYQSLALALVPGLLAAIAGQMIHFWIPFGGMLILMILALISLERVWHSLRG